MKYLFALIPIGLLCLGGWAWLQLGNTPQTCYYGRALFGDNPANAAAWQHFIVKGDKVFSDQNKDNIADDTEVFDSKQGMKLAVDGRNYTIVSVQTGIDPDAVSESLPQRLQLVVDVDDSRPFRMAGKMLLGQNPEDCNWLQFGGNLQFIVMDEPKLKAGAESAELKIFIGTATSGPPSTAAVEQQVVSGKPDVFRTAIVLPIRQ